MSYGHDDPPHGRRHRARVLFVRLTEKEHAELAAAERPHSWIPLGVWAREAILAAARKLPKKTAIAPASHPRARARLATSPAPRLAKAAPRSRGGR